MRKGNVAVDALLVNGELPNMTQAMFASVLLGLSKGGFAALGTGVVTV